MFKQWWKTGNNGTEEIDSVNSTPGWCGRSYTQLTHHYSAKKPAQHMSLNMPTVPFMACFVWVILLYDYLRSREATLNGWYKPVPNRNKAKQTINPLRAKFFWGNTNIYLHFMSFLHIDLTQVLKHFLKQEKHLHVLYSQYHGCWCPGDVIVIVIIMALLLYHPRSHGENHFL